MKDYIKELQKIAESEINFSINCFYDDGFRFEIGDDLNGRFWFAKFEDLKTGIKVLIKKVKELYPKSYYVMQKMVKNET